jgi:hypothetical protein
LANIASPVIRAFAPFVKYVEVWSSTFSCN